MNQLAIHPSTVAQARILTGDFLKYMTLIEPNNCNIVVWTSPSILTVRSERRFSLASYDDCEFHTNACVRDSLFPRRVQMTPDSVASEISEHVKENPTAGGSDLTVVSQPVESIC